MALSEVHNLTAIIGNNAFAVDKVSEYASVCVFVCCVCANVYACMYIVALHFYVCT